MRTIALAFTILFLIVSCSSTGRVGSDDGANQASGYQSDQPAKQSRQAKTDGALSSGASKGKSRIAIADEEDNITSLLEHDDFKDFDLPIVFNDAVKYYVIYFTSEKKKVFANWLKRSRRYVPMIRVILKEHGLPEDLVYLAMIESGFNPKAYSSAKACGPWQFIYETGGRYGLKVNFWIDERRDPEKSTIAAAKYLTDLFNQFGCWYLAAAGYNAGEKRVERAIEKHNTNDFWELAKYNALPRETREYIPKLIAASIIAKDPERFGFGGINYDEPMRFVEMKVPRASSLAAVAKASSMGIGELKSLNPEILRGISPPYTDDYRIKVRTSTNIARASEALEASAAGERKIKDVMAYKVKKKDTLAKILKRYGVKETEMYLVNDCQDQIRVKPGMVVNIPRFSGPQPTASTVMASIAPVPLPAAKKERAETENVKVTRTAKPPEKQGRTEPVKESAKLRDERAPAKAYHIVKRGETLSEISSKYGIEMASLKSANHLKDETVYPNMKLMLASHHQTRRHKEAPPSVRIHTVKKGETLAQIAGKYGVNVASLKSANNLKTGRVHPKMRLKIVSAEG